MLDLIYRPCAIEHIALIKPQGGKLMDKEYFMQPGFHHMIDDNFSMSAWAGNTCILAAGIMPIYKDRAMCWALMGEGAGPYMRKLTVKTRAGLDMQPYKRLEMVVDYEFKAGHQWAKMLGFKVEADRMRHSGVYGNDETLYARIK